MAPVAPIAEKWDGQGTSYVRLKVQIARFGNNRIGAGIGHGVLVAGTRRKVNTMAIFERVADILKANINDLIDRAEDPEKMVKQLIVEMDKEIDKATQALGQAMGSQKVAAMELADAKAAASDWNDKAKLALKAGNEVLAKKALDAKVGVDEQVEALQANYDKITENVDKLKAQVEELKMKLDEARSRQNVLIARSKMAAAAQSTAVTINSSTTDSAFAKLDALERKIAEKEATAEAYAGINTNEIIISDEDEFAKLEHAAAVEDQLAALKKELKIKD